jgi:AraC-like DNA-binding protein
VDYNRGILLLADDFTGYDIIADPPAEITSLDFHNAIDVFLHCDIPGRGIYINTQFQFSTMLATSHSIFTGITLVNLVMIAFLLLFVKGNRNIVANLLLSLFCLNYAAVNGYDLVVAKQTYYRYPALIEVDTLLLLPLGPLCYLYVREMTQIKFKFQLKHLVHLLPIIIYLIYLLPFKLQPVSTQLAQFHRWQSDRHVAPLMMVYFSKAVVIAYLLATYRMLTEHQRIVPQLLSNIEDNNLQWIKVFIIVLILLALLWILNNEGLLMGRLYFDLCQVAFTYWLGYYVINQKAIYANVTDTVSLHTLIEGPKIRYRNPTMTEAARKGLADRISKYLIDEKPYLNKELTLTILADLLRLPPVQLSQVLNEGFGENFYAFINRYRVEESKRLLIDPAFTRYNILGIAYESGFNSKSTFNKTFRDVTGLSPSDYQKKYSNPEPGKLHS